MRLSVILFVRPCVGLAVVGLILMPTARLVSREIERPLTLKPGPQLFIDDHLIAESSFLTRVVNNPEKLPKPVVTGGKTGDDNFQPYISVLRDPQTKRFRMWYNTGVAISQSHVGYIESEDGINWLRPHRVLKDPGTNKFGVSVVDRGEKFSDPTQRYVLGYYHKDGLMVATSPDGSDWTLLKPTSVLQHNHDIDSLRWEESKGITIGSDAADVDWRPVQKTLNHLRDHYSAPIYARDVARAAGISESRLKVLFQEMLGISWVKYLQGYRIHRAASPPRGAEVLSSLLLYYYFFIHVNTPSIIGVSEVAPN